MRILLVSDYATPSGGAELMVLALRNSLRQRGHDARLLASSARPLNLPSQADYECFGMLSAARGLTQVANPSAYIQLKRVLREFRPDVVHVRLFLSQLSPLILPLLKDVPSIYHVAWYRCICPIGTKMLPSRTACHEPAGAACLKHGCVPLYAWPSATLQMKLWRHWRSAFKLIVANSHATRRRLEGDGIQPVEVVWNGVPDRAPPGPLLDRPTIAFAGRLVSEKGTDVLLEAFARVLSRVPAARLLIAGDGPQRQQLASIVQRLGLDSSVLWLGHLSRETMEERFAGIWVQAVPSRWEEPFGIVAAEAMMRGTAVVASNAGGLAEIIQNSKTGVLVQPDNVDDLASALTDLLQSPKRAEQMGRSGREFALRDLRLEAFVDRFIEVYQRLVQERALAR